MTNSPSPRSAAVPSEVIAGRDFSDATPLMAEFVRLEQPVAQTRPLEPHWVELIEAATD